LSIDAHIVANGLEPAARLRVYRNNSREGFVTTLRAAYPVLERLVGEDYFRQLASTYREQFPSPSGNLHHVGERLPGFLARRYAATEFAYFADVARLEWALQEVLVAADHPPLDAARLQSVPADEFARLSFVLHPAAHLVSSPFPVVTIWSANQPGADPGQTIDLGSGAEHVLLLRTRDDVRFERLDAAQFAFLACLQRGATLVDAIDGSDAGDTGDAFDAGECLRRHVAAGALVDFTILEEESA
jgi:Putative DNA-binding domain